MSKRHIVLSYQPFDAQQTIMVYENGECTEVVHCVYCEITEMIAMLSKKYNIKKVDLRGNEEFVSKFKEELISPRFNFNDLDVTLW